MTYDCRVIGLINENKKVRVDTPSGKMRNEQTISNWDVSKAFYLNLGPSKIKSI